jgi:6,7-dimethyl-8-ribityllumazine synthase
MTIKKGPEKLNKAEQALNPENITIGIAVAEWNKAITSALLDGCMKILIEYGFSQKNIILKWVPGSFELPLVAQWLAELKNVDAVICLGCVIKGETPHNHYISQSVALGISNLSLELSIPVIFGVLTTNNEQQAIDRAGGKMGNKGADAAIAAIKMLVLRSELEN